MTLKKLCTSTLLATAMLTQTPVQAENISTATVIAETAEGYFSCADWGYAGQCFFLRCGFFGCKVRTSPWVEHWAPELTFQTYRDAEDPPWTETKWILDAAQVSHDGSIVSLLLNAIGSPIDEMGGGGGSESKAASHSNMTFTLTDAIGNPLMNGTGYIPGVSDIICVPRLTSMYPYYISNADIEWRIGLLEMLDTDLLNPVSNLLGSTTYNWGHYKPRVGFVTNHDELKESALIAFRAAHFISRTGEPHVYRTTAGQSSSMTFEPPQGGVTLTNAKWQQISPKGEGGCNFFPLDMSLSVSDGKSSYRDDDGNMVWNMWREYGCCRDRGIDLFKVTW